ncbi:hypothetical protein V6N12_018894 [Hibiscus sabdariffa]|uniref:Uncharacterized protein n=1 Tax=Hibiscus sabdariffa TaxID=183260 RepID=A0ABR2ATE9_9ROSI
MFETLAIVEIRENPDEFLEMEAIVNCLQAVEQLDEASVHNPETLTSSTFDKESVEISCPETIHVNVVGNIFEIENLSFKEGEKDEESKEMGSEIRDPKILKLQWILNGEELEEAKAIVSSQRVKVNYIDNCINNEKMRSCFGNLGPMRKEKVWKWTLACKLLEEKQCDGDDDNG